MNTFYRVRGIFFALFGTVILLTVVYDVVQAIVHRLSSGAWHFVSFGEASGNAHPAFPSGLIGSVFSTIWNAPHAIVAAVIGGGLLWQGLRAISYR